MPTGPKGQRRDQRRVNSALGLAMLGLLTLLVCANVEFGKDGPLGGINNLELHA